MNTKQLEALVIDQSLGELPEDVSALLDAYLALHPEAQKDATRLKEAVGTTAQAVQRHPQLFRQAGEGASGILILARVQQWLEMPQVRRMAAVVVIGLAVGFGFLTGNRQPSPDASVLADNDAIKVIPSETQAEQADSDPVPWARYRVDTSNLGAGISVVVAAADSNRVSK